MSEPSDVRERFRAYCDERDIRLSVAQREAADAILSCENVLVFRGRRSGFTFLMKTLEGFLRS